MERFSGHVCPRLARPLALIASVLAFGGCGIVRDGGQGDPSPQSGAGDAGVDGGGSSGAPSPIPGFLPKARFVPSVGRVLDTRLGPPGRNWLWTSFLLEPYVPRNVLGVAVNLTATGASKATHLSTCWALCDVPATSNLNIVPGQTVANMVIVANQPHFDESRLVITNGDEQDPVASIDAVVDLLGYFVPDDPATSGGYIACDRHAQRVFDSRLGAGKIAAGGRITLHVGDPDSVAMLSVTVANSEAPGFISVLPAPGAPITTSTTNYQANDTRGNLTMMKLDGAGNATFFTAATTHLIVDRVASLVAHGRPCPANADFGAAGASFVLGTARRLLDTRTIAGNPLDAGVRSYGVTPPDTVAMLANLTAVNSIGAGYFFDATQSTSILNMQPGDVRASFAVFPVMNDGPHSWFNLGNMSPSASILDLAGYLVRNRNPQPAAPRLLYGAFSADGDNHKVQQPGASQASTWIQLPILVEQPSGAATGPTAPVALHQENLGVVRINEFITAATIGGPPSTWGVGNNRPFDPRADGFANKASWEIDFIHGTVRYVATPSCVMVNLGAPEVCLEARPVTTRWDATQDANKVMFRAIERPDGVHYYAYSSAENPFSNLPSAPHCAIDTGFELFVAGGVLQARPWNPERGVYLEPYPSVEVYQYDWDGHPGRTLFQQRESADGPARLCDYENRNPFRLHPLN